MDSWQGDKELRFHVVELRIVHSKASLGAHCNERWALEGLPGPPILRTTPAPQPQQLERFCSRGLNDVDHSSSFRDHRPSVTDTIVIAICRNNGSTMPELAHGNPGPS